MAPLSLVATPALEAARLTARQAMILGLLAAVPGWGLALAIFAWSAGSMTRQQPATLICTCMKEAATP